MVRPSWVEIDLGAITHNTATIAAAIAPARLCAVVKADAYGHGDVPVADAALAGGASVLAVALVEEGVRLREAGIDVPILVLSEPDESEIPQLIAAGLTPTVYRRRTAWALAREVRTRLPVHVKVDTGMHRVGADPEAGVNLARVLTRHEAFRLEAVWTHLAVAEEDPEFTRYQLELFEQFVAAVRLARANPEYLHAANTAGALAYPEARYDMARIGLGLYGLRPGPEIGLGLGLRPAMRVVSRVSFTRRVSAGERVSYGRRRAMPAEGTLATVPIGYADGVSRRLSDAGGEVLIRGRSHPFAGTVTMDQIVVDVGDTEVEVGDEVVLLGAQGDFEIGADDWAQWLDTISYEIVCRFGPRLPRRYVGGP